MNERDLFNAIDSIDDKLIAEASVKPSTKNRYFRRISAAAAVVAITVLCAAAAHYNNSSVLNVQTTRNLSSVRASASGTLSGSETSRSSSASAAANGGSANSADTDGSTAAAAAEPEGTLAAANSASAGTGASENVKSPENENSPGSANVFPHNSVSRSTSAVASQSSVPTTERNSSSGATASGTVSERTTETSEKTTETATRAEADETTTGKNSIVATTRRAPRPAPPRLTTDSNIAMSDIGSTGVPDATRALPCVSGVDDENYWNIRTDGLVSYYGVADSAAHEFDSDNRTVLDVAGTEYVEISPDEYYDYGVNYVLDSSMLTSRLGIVNYSNTSSDSRPYVIASDSSLDDAAAFVCGSNDIIIVISNGTFRCFARN